MAVVYSIIDCCARKSGEQKAFGKAIVGNISEVSHQLIRTCLASLCCLPRKVAASLSCPEKSLVLEAGSRNSSDFIAKCCRSHSLIQI